MGGNGVEGVTKTVTGLDGVTRVIVYNEDGEVISKHVVEEVKASDVKPDEASNDGPAMFITGLFG